MEVQTLQFYDKNVSQNPTGSNVWKFNQKVRLKLFFVGDPNVLTIVFLLDLKAGYYTDRR